MKIPVLLITFTALVFFVITSMNVHSGFLNATSEEVAEGTRFTLFWSQGCGPNCRVDYLSGGLFGYRNLNLGPNSCNTGAPDGNNRAIHCLINSDASGPNVVDARLNCNTCHCELNPGTNFLCQATGICDECYACDTYPCPSGQTCTHVNCTSRICSGCDDVVCESQTTSWSDWGSCDAPVASCGTTSGQESRTRTVYSCSSSGNCVGNLETQYQACTRSNGGCSGRWDCTGSCASYVSGTCTGYSCGYTCSSGSCVQSCSTSMMVCETG